VLGLTDFPGIPLAKERRFLRVFSKFLQDHGARADPPCAHRGDYTRKRPARSPEMKKPGPPQQDDGRSRTGL
ncbi:hypothetical protein FQA47_022383, partial [Oryzias melastigma]